MDILFFEGPGKFRDWLSANHDKVDEQWVGYYKKGSGRPSITWPESVDEALCFGWIDGLRKSIDEESYKIRFTPRRPNSNWSAVNIRHLERLLKAGRMQPSGLRAYENRKVQKDPYSYEKAEDVLDKEYIAELRANPEAWEFFNNLAPYARKQSIHWVMSAKREETRRKRLAVLIESSADGRKIPPLIISRSK